MITFFESFVFLELCLDGDLSIVTVTDHIRLMLFAAFGFGAMVEILLRLLYGTHAIPTFCTNYLTTISCRVVRHEIVAWGNGSYRCITKGNNTWLHFHFVYVCMF